MAVDQMFNDPAIRQGKIIFMIPKTFREVIDLGDGREISIETGKLAKQAHGSVVVQSGKCMLLCTVVSNYKASDVDFLPLTVDYREKFAAAGRYPGGFFKREARPSDGEVVEARGCILIASGLAACWRAGRPRPCRSWPRHEAR